MIGRADLVQLDKLEQWSGLQWDPHKHTITTKHFPSISLPSTTTSSTAAPASMASLNNLLNPESTQERESRFVGTPPQTTAPFAHRSSSSPRFTGCSRSRMAAPRHQCSTWPTSAPSHNQAITHSRTSLLDLTNHIQIVQIPSPVCQIPTADPNIPSQLFYDVQYSAVRSDD